MNNEGMTATVRAMMTDDSGKFLVGIENGITAAMVLNKQGIFENDVEAYYWSRKHNQATVECNKVMNEFTKAGYVAGGMSRKPTYYFIARRGNRREEALILYKKVKNATGHMKNTRSIGNSAVNKELVDIKKLSAAIKYLESITSKLDQSDDTPLLGF